MLDLAGATKSASLLMSSTPTAANNLPMVSQKKKDEIQNIGIYDLIFPTMHNDYVTREELLVTLQSAFMNHNTANRHNGAYSTPGMPSRITVERIPKEVIVEGLKVRAGSPVNSIGYNI